MTTPSTDAPRIVAVGDRWAEWDRFVAADPHSTFAHRSGWARVIRAQFRQDTDYLVAEDAAGTWQGILPLVHLRGVLGHHLLSMPYLNDGGPLGSEPARAALAAKAIAVAAGSKAKVLELRNRKEIAGTGHGVRKIAVHLELPSTVEDLWSKTFKAKLRSQVRRPSKEGMTARHGLGELDAFYEVFARNMRDLGTPVYPRGFFEQIASTFGDDVLFVSVRTAQGAPAAAACCLHWRDELEVTWASSIREYNPMAPNMLLYATMMELAIGRRVRLFNFGRSTPGAATHKFKQQWGGVDIPLPWTVWPPATGGDRSPLVSAAISTWRRLPLPIANRLGPLIAGQLPW